MAAKEVKFGSDARQRMLHGVDILANAVKVTRSTRPDRSVQPCSSRPVRFWTITGIAVALGAHRARSSARKAGSGGFFLAAALDTPKRLDIVTGTRPGRVLTTGHLAVRYSRFLKEEQR